VLPAVYIPNFNGSAQLGRTLRSLAAQTRPLQVVLVDNGSSDESVALARRELPEIKVLELESNLGFGPALNRAVAEHPADPLILLNNDVECEPRFLEALLDGLGVGVD
jgi:GT2 family glycosyltransferase